MTMPSTTWMGLVLKFLATTDSMNFLKKTAANSSPIVIFGASVIGKIILDSLEILNVQPACFCDNDIQKQRDLFNGYEVIPFEKLCADYSDAFIIIAAGRYFDEIQRQLLNAGFENIFCDIDVLSCINFKKTEYSKLQKITWHLAKSGKLSEILDLPGDSLHIPRLNVVLTSRCTLRCEHCSSLIPHYKKQYDFDTLSIIASLDKIFTCTNLIYHVELLGGELFLDKDFPRIAEHLINTGKILHIDVITNGTIVPPDSMLEILKHDNVGVVIDDYGELSKKTETLSNSLQRLGIDFRVNKHWAWADLGGFDSRNLSEKQLAKMFARCNFNSCTELLDGKLHRCPRSSHGTETGLVPEYSEDFIDINKFSPNNKSLKEKLRSFFYDKKFIRACNHCNGNTSDSLTLTPAEQQTQR